ncbi:MAG: aminoglycoside phosphotransferase family protein [Bryobacteraceae bacterium]
MSCAWVASVARADGSSAVLKFGMPHMESEHELHGLRFWNGNPTVRLLEADDDLGAMLLERCGPGTVRAPCQNPSRILSSRNFLIGSGARHQHPTRSARSRV